MYKNVIGNLSEPKHKRLTVGDLVLTVQQVLADAGGVLSGSQGLLDALDHVAQVVKGLQDV